MGPGINIIAIGQSVLSDDFFCQMVVSLVFSELKRKAFKKFFYFFFHRSLKFGRVPFFISPGFDEIPDKKK